MNKQDKKTFMFIFGAQRIMNNIRMFNQASSWVMRSYFIGSIMIALALIFLFTDWDRWKLCFYYIGSFFAHFSHLLGRMHAHFTNYGNYFDLSFNQIYSSEIAFDNFISSMILLLVFIAIGLSIASIGLYLAYKFIIKDGTKYTNIQHLNGVTLTEDYKEINEILKHDKMTSDYIKFDNLCFPQDKEVGNFLFDGTQGQGKTQMLLKLIKCTVNAQSNHRHTSKSVIFDKGCVLTPYLYREDRDLILNPLDTRSQYWCLWNDAPTVVEVTAIANAFIPKDLSGSDPFWVTTARKLFTSIVERLREHKDRSYKLLHDYLSRYDEEAIAELIKGTDATLLIDKDVKKTSKSIRIVLNVATDPIRYLVGSEFDENGNKKEPFSLREWLSNDGIQNNLILPCKEKDAVALAPLITSWVTIINSNILNLPESFNRNIWIFLDEIYSLNPIPEFANFLSVGRKHGAKTAIGLQDYYQLEDRYGIQGAKIIFDRISNRFFFAHPSYDLCQKIANELGYRQVQRPVETTTAGSVDMRDSTSISLNVVEELIVKSYDIQHLKPFQCYVWFGVGLPVLKYQFQYQAHYVLAKDYLPLDKALPNSTIADDTFNSSQIDNAINTPQDDESQDNEEQNNKEYTANESESSDSTQASEDKDCDAKWDNNSSDNSDDEKDNPQEENESKEGIKEHNSEQELDSNAPKQIDEKEVNGSQKTNKRSTEWL